MLCIILGGIDMKLYILMSFIIVIPLHGGEFDRDALAVALSTQASSNKIRVAYGDGDSLRTHITDFFNGLLATNDTYYMRMTKEAEKLIVTMYYDSERTEVRATQSITVPTTVTGLQYIKFQNRNDTGVNGNITGTVGKVELYDGVTTVENIPSQQTALLK